MNDQIMTQHFIVWQLPVSFTETRTAGIQPRQVCPMEAGYEYDEHELGEELAAARQRQPLRSQAHIEPEEFEAAYKWFLS